MSSDFNFTPSEVDAMRAATAILRAADVGDIDAMRVLSDGGNTFDTIQCLASLALSIAGRARIDVQAFTALVLADINSQDRAA
ncbi:hypothetical protein [Nocardia farcinica]|uniref:hypothetical protein n=1 Tax=Nocardia farcinica TaxID=37329 RepID=UPI002454CBBE|nr:hypothetical protein [Nocardia farcinica]